MNYRFLNMNIILEKLYLLLACCLFIIFFTIKSSAQEIEAVVSIDTEMLSSEQLQRIDNLKNNLEDYLNSQSFTGKQWEGAKIPVGITLQLSGSGRNTFAANMFIVSKRAILGEEDGSSVAMKFIDKKWNFEYNQNSSLSYDPNRFDNITSVLDFYMLVIIGLDLDTYGELDGSSAFSRALNILNLAVNNNSNGWVSYSDKEFTRQTLINELTNARFDKFRTLMFDYYYDGIDMLTTNREDALDNISNTIDEMADFKERIVVPSHIMDNFFYSKSQELAELFKGYKKNQKVFRNLMFLDTPNTPLYEAAKEEK